MKLFSVSASLNSRAYSLYQKIQKQLFSSTPTRARTRIPLSRNKPDSDSLYSRISPVGDPNVSIIPVLDHWINEGNPAYKGELQRIVVQLSTYRRFKHALEVSLWMTNKRRYPEFPTDIAVRLKLIFKIFGIERVEDYFNKIPENLKTYHVYLALLNCYTIAKSIDKAESIMQKARDLGFASKPIWYNLIMKLHCQLGNREKVGDLLTEMESKGISYDNFTHSVCLSACAMASDAAGMDKVVASMESDKNVIFHWRTYIIAANGYLKLGLIDKALMMLNKLEEQLMFSERNIALLAILLKLYAEAGKKDELYRTWNACKKNGRVFNKVYISMMRSLMKFDDIEEVEKIFEEWELSGLPYDFRVPNILIDVYCTDGKLENAKTLITKGISRGGNPLVVTWCHLVGGYLKKNLAAEALEALKKAIAVCPPRFMAQKDSLRTCLEYLENGECMEKVEKLIEVVRQRGISGEVGLDDDSCGSIEDGEFQSSGQDRNCEEEMKL